MHAISFLAKRVHLMTTRFGQRVLDACRVEGMTPARFDLLCLLRQPGVAMQRRFPQRGRTKSKRPVGSDHALMTQAAIVRRLGLHPSTVSKMIKRLVEMNWLRVVRAYRDRRFKLVELTPLGFRRIWEAMRRVFRGRLMLRPFEEAHRAAEPELHVLDVIAATFIRLNHLAGFFGDRSDFVYDFHWGVDRDCFVDPDLAVDFDS